MSSSRSPHRGHHPHSQHPPPIESVTTRPATIAELAEKAREDVWDPNKHLKHWLRTAEQARKQGKQYAEQGDFERSFIQLARAATIILEKMPGHRDYQTLLNETQRHNLSLHGQETLDNLSKLKPGLVERYDRWKARNPELANNPNIKPVVLCEPPTPDGDSGEHRFHKEPSRDELRRDDSRKRMEAEEAERRRAISPQSTVPEVNRMPSLSRSPQEDMLKQRIDERRMHEQVGILQRQQEADAAAHATRRAHEMTGVPQITIPPPLSAPAPQHPGYSQHPPIIMPQPQPHSQPTYPQQRYGDPAPSSSYSASMPQLNYPTNNNGHGPPIPPPQGVNNAINRFATDPSFTTTSSSPLDATAPIRYPSLMSQHQMKQGYVPSLHSMFQPAPGMGSSVGYESGSGAGGAGSLLFQGEAQALYANPLPAPSQSVPSSSYAPSSSIPSSSRPPPATSHNAPTPPTDPRITPANPTDLISKDLKTVYLPRECLPRFLNIAAINTARNRETCGLLLGKDKRSRFVVTTLLIPKQHSTSDTCTMDEEELVMSFTEERSLITLGWIHTHPTQSCFMSSVDLHTHSGFQRMLPESFAVVCAPTSTPSFGIFRLTDPPGLQSILDCTAKEAFHPHPPVPIYTDADKGHVQIKDSLSLEIVDLRDN